MTKALWRKALTLDKKYTKSMWEDLIKLIKGNYSITRADENEAFIKIPKAEGFDIEIYPGLDISVHKFSIHVWDNRNGNKTIFSIEVDSLAAVINTIDTQLKEIPKKLKHNLL